MIEKSPNEKLTEMLFVHHFLQMFSKEEVMLYAPSTREEAKLGYDSGFLGLDSCFELVLQFKTPNLNENHSYRIDLNKRQFAILKDIQEIDVFYISHFFRNSEILQKAFVDNSDPLKFLNSYIAFDVRNIESDTNSITYTEPTLHSKDDTAHDCSAILNRHRMTNPIGNLKGSSLIDRFRKRQIGHYVEFGKFYNAHGKLLRKSAQRLPHVQSVRVSSSRSLEQEINTDITTGFIENIASNSTLILRMNP